MGAKIIELIHTDIKLAGNGLDDPFRRIQQYWTKDGNLLFEKDSTSEKVVEAGELISFIKANLDDEEVIETLYDYITSHQFRRYWLITFTRRVW